MDEGALGRVYQDGEDIVRQGETGDCMYVIQQGRVAVLRADGDRLVKLGELGDGAIFGEMAVFERESRAATVRAIGPARVLTVDKRTFMRRVLEDPSIALNILRTMSHRIRELDRELVRLGQCVPGDRA